MNITLECFGLTDRGKERRLNEDHFLIAELAKRMIIRQTSLPDGGSELRMRGQMGYLLVVADGMGGVSGGEVASGLAVETISWYVTRTMPWFHRFEEGREDALNEDLVSAVQTCQQSVSKAARSTDYRRMGTTLTMACILWPRAYVVHAGDSRCYLLRAGQLMQMTKDHTVAQRVVDEGIMSPSQAERAGYGHTLWNCIGGGTGGVQPDVYRAELEVGDTLLLCTDGLTRELNNEAIRAMLQHGTSLKEAVESLIAAANDSGGHDNITVVAARAAERNESDHDTISDGMMFLPPL